MIALARFDNTPLKSNDNYKLIKLIRQLKPQSTSREIENEEPATYRRNRLRDNCDMGTG